MIHIPLLRVVTFLALVSLATNLQAERRRTASHPDWRLHAAVAGKVQPVLDRGVPGVTVAISKQGRLLLNASFGQQMYYGSPVVMPNDVFEVGSITKQFTAAAIVRLAEQGKLNVNDEVRKYVPEVDTHGTTITIRQLLSHTSGLGNYLQKITNAYKPVTQSQMIALINGMPLLFPPGASWSYSNSGFYLLGVIIERVSGRAYSDFIRDELITPAGLGSTGVCGSSPNATARTSSAYYQNQWIEIPPVDMTIPFSAGALCSTAHDLVQWTEALESGRIVSPASYAEMSTSSTLNNGSKVAYGYGFFTHSISGRKAVSHGGAIAGYNAQLTSYEDSGVVVAVLINALPLPDTINATDLEEEISNAILPLIQ